MCTSNHNTQQNNYSIALHLLQMCGVHAFVTVISSVSRTLQGGEQGTLEHASTLYCPGSQHRAEEFRVL